MPDLLEQIRALTSQLDEVTLGKLELKAKLDEVTLGKLELKAKLDEVTLGKLELKAKLDEVTLGKLELKAKLDGTYLEDCDGLWLFTREHLPKEKDEQLNLFYKISRTTLRRCYNEIDTQFATFTAQNLPNPTTKSLGTSTSVQVNGRVDIFNNKWSNQRAHLIPDSPTCAPYWGHSAEGALQPLPNNSELNKNKARTLLVMGYEKSRKLRKVPQNFIKFADHREVYDVDPSVIIIPIMDLYELRDSWEAGTSFDALVIASKITKTGRTEPCLAAETYQKILSHFEYKDENFCTPEDIDAATLLIRHFLLGHAGSLAAGIPTDIDPGASSSERNDVLSALEVVKGEIINNGVALPGIHKEKTFRKVLKVHFPYESDDPIPDPWLLAAKAAVNLSSTRGQKLLPACKKAEEDDYEIMQELHEYQMRRRLDNLPAELNIIYAMGEVLDTPPQTSRSGAFAVTPPPQVNRSGAVVVTPPKQEGWDDWETLGD